MKTFFKNISLCILSFSVLLSTFSFTVDKHYCGDFLVDVAFNSEAKGCDMENDTTTTMKNCCKNEKEQIKGQDQFKLTQLEDVAFQQQVFIAAFYATFIGDFTFVDSENHIYKEYQPPKPVKDYQVAFQTFLI